jgi:hypothetical protein
VKKLLQTIIFPLFFVFILGTTNSFAQDYYISNAGNDKNPGTSPDKPWESIARVNGFQFAPGDVIHFKCGDTWREQLVPAGGTGQGTVQYTSYGAGEKPLLLGSVNKSNPSDWKKEGGNIWSIAPSHNRIISQKSISVEDTTFWTGEANAAEKSVISNGSGGKCLELRCNNPCGSIYDMQLMVDGLNIRNGNSYLFSFRAKSTADFVIPAVKLIKNTSPWTDCFSQHNHWVQKDPSGWVTYKFFYEANCNDDNAEINIFLGKYFPQGTTLYMDSLSFAEVENSDIYYDVGNIIFDQGRKCGAKVFSAAALKKQDDFFYDGRNRALYIYSLKNPAELYDSIELALDRHIVDINHKGYITINNLSLKYGGANGIFGMDTQHITIANCHIAYIGGSVLEWKADKAVRYGNGINFVQNNHDNLVEGCSIREIYDAAVTNQGNGDQIRQYNITYRNNKIWNAEWSFEYWNCSDNGLTHDLYFEHNICQYAGYGWGSSQRPNPSGMHICFTDNTAKTSRVYIRNNVFKYSTTCHLYVNKNWNGKENLVLENNVYIQNKDRLVVVWGISEIYYANDFHNYKKRTGKDGTSLIYAV